MLHQRLGAQMSLILTKSPLKERYFHPRFDQEAINLKPTKFSMKKSNR